MAAKPPCFVSSSSSRTSSQASSQAASPVKRQKRVFIPRDIPRYLDAVALRYTGRYATSSGHLAEVLTRRIRKLDYEIARLVPRQSNFSSNDNKSNQNNNNNNNNSTSLLTPEVVVHIQQLSQRMVSSGVIDDRAFAQSGVHRLLRQGSSIRKIKAWLQSKRIDSKLVDETIAKVVALDPVSPSSAHSETHSHSTELASAMVYIRRKKLGRCRRMPIADADADVDADGEFSPEQKEPAGDEPEVPELVTRGKLFQKDLSRLMLQGFSFAIASKALQITTPKPNSIL